MSKTFENITFNLGVVLESSLTGSSGELQSINAVYRLNGRNYLQWSQIVRMLLKGKGKISHLDGTGLSSDDLKFQAWDEDSMIMSWLWNSMQLEISRNLVFLL